jgi:hypothetical protein
MENKPLIDLIIGQALEIITRTSPFGNIPLVNTAIKSIATTSIKIALENTLLSKYIVPIKQIEDDLNKQANDVREARELLKKAVTPAEKLKAENDVKEALRKLLNFNN